MSKKSKQLKALDNFQINDYFTTAKDYLGTVSVDEIKAFDPKKQGYFIYNSATRLSPTGGVHWNCCYNVHPKYCIWFDSFGAAPDQRALQWGKKTGKINIYQTLQLQSLNSQACGYYCIYILKELNKGRSIVDIINQDFSLDTKSNEKVLQFYFKS
jgi:hypothetical protein